MTVTKQQQLEWLVKNWDAWMVNSVGMVGMSRNEVGEFGITHWISDKEWQQERDKMQKQSAQPVQPSPDNSRHERGELPPVGCECQFFSDGYDDEWFDWCIFHGLATCGGLIIEHHHRTSPSRVTVALFDPASTKFRSLHTEREKAIDAACDVICKNGVHDFERGVITKLYDAGMLK